MCWQDYCPCDEEGITAKNMCRRLRAGIPVGDREMADAAAIIDASNKLRDYNREHPDETVGDPQL